MYTHMKGGGCSLLSLWYRSMQWIIDGDNLLLLASSSTTIGEQSSTLVVGRQSYLDEMTNCVRVAVAPPNNMRPGFQSKMCVVCAYAGGLVKVWETYSVGSVANSTVLNVPRHSQNPGRSVGVAGLIWSTQSAAAGRDHQRESGPSQALAIVFADGCVEVYRQRALDEEREEEDPLFEKEESAVDEKWSLVSSHKDLFHGSSVTSAAEVADASAFLLVIGFRSGHCCLLDAMRGNVLRQVVCHSSGGTAVAVSLSGSLMCSGGDDGIVMLWALPDLSEVATLPLGHHEDVVNSVAFTCQPSTPQQVLLVSGSADGVLCVWQVDSFFPLPSASALLLHKIVMPCGVCDAQFVPWAPTSVVGVGCRDGSIRFWSFGAESGGQQVGHIPGARHAQSRISNLSFQAVEPADASGDLRSTCRVGLMVSCGVEAPPMVWSIVRGAEITGVLQGHTKQITAVSSLQLSLNSTDDDDDDANCASPAPQQTLIATGSADCHVKIWLVTCHKKGEGFSTALVATFIGHTDTITDICMMRAGQEKGSGSSRILVASASADFSLRLWEVVSPIPLLSGALPVRSDAPTAECFGHSGVVDRVLLVSRRRGPPCMLSFSHEDTGRHVMMWGVATGNIEAVYSSSKRRGGSLTLVSLCCRFLFS